MVKLIMAMILIERKSKRKYRQVLNLSKTAKAVAVEACKELMSTPLGDMDICLDFQEEKEQFYVFSFAGKSPAVAYEKPIFTPMNLGEYRD